MSLPPFLIVAAVLAGLRREDDVCGAGDGRRGSARTRTDGPSIFDGRQTIRRLEALYEAIVAERDTLTTTLAMDTGTYATAADTATLATQ
jgi:hypothetical protein